MNGSKTKSWTLVQEVNTMVHLEDPSFSGLKHFFFPGSGLSDTSLSGNYIQRKKSCLFHSRSLYRGQSVSNNQYSCGCKCQVFCLQEGQFRSIIPAPKLLVGLVVVFAVTALQFNTLGPILLFFYSYTCIDPEGTLQENSCSQISMPASVAYGIGLL